MTLNISDLRIAISQGYDTSEEDALQLLDIVEAGKRGVLQYKLCERLKCDESVGALAYEAELRKLEEHMNEFNELLEDVEIGDE